MDEKSRRVRWTWRLGGCWVGSVGRQPAAEDRMIAKHKKDEEEEEEEDPSLRPQY